MNEDMEHMMGLITIFVIYIVGMYALLYGEWVLWLSFGFATCVAIESVCISEICLKETCVEEICQ